MIKGNSSIVEIHVYVTYEGSVVNTSSKPFNMSNKHDAYTVLNKRKLTPRYLQIILPYNETTLFAKVVFILKFCFIPLNRGIYFWIWTVNFFVHCKNNPNCTISFHSVSFVIIFVSLPDSDPRVEVTSTYNRYYIVTCQAHPALVKRVQWSVRIFQFLVVYH